MKNFYTTLALMLRAQAAEDEDREDELSGRLEVMWEKMSPAQRLIADSEMEKIVQGVITEEQFCEAHCGSDLSSIKWVYVNPRNLVEDDTLMTVRTLGEAGYPVFSKWAENPQGTCTAHLAHLSTHDREIPNTQYVWRRTPARSREREFYSL